MIYRKNGYIQSPEDERDYPLEKLFMAVRIPDEYMSEPAPVLDQGSVGCCVAETLATMRYIQEHRQHETKDEFSPMMIYANRAENDFKGEGMIPREALKVLQSDGVCLKEYLDGLWEYEEASIHYGNVEKIVKCRAYPYRISSYYRLKNTYDIKQAVYKTGCAQVCVPVYECLYHPENGVVMYKPGLAEGGHSMTCIGYEKDYLIIQNSWGTEYGDNGIIKLDASYPITEAWACVDTIMEQELRKEQ